MINVTLVYAIQRGGVDLAVESFYTSHVTNNLFLTFDTDENARNSEEILKNHGFKTSHSECTITVHNIADIDIIVK